MSIFLSMYLIVKKLTHIYIIFVDRDGNTTYKFRSRIEFLNHYKENGIKNIPSILLGNNHILFNSKFVYKLKCCNVLVSKINRQGNISKVSLLSKKSSKKIQSSLPDSNAASNEKMGMVLKASVGKKNLKSKNKRRKNTAVVKEDPVYAVEKIVNKRTHGRQTLYLIKWKDFDTSQNTWEPENQLIKDGLKPIIDHFNESNYQGRTLPNNNTAKGTSKQKQKLHNAIEFSPKPKKQKTKRAKTATTSPLSSIVSINGMPIEKRFEKDGTPLYYL